MEWLILVLEVIILVGLGALALLAKRYLPSYIEEKGKNLATKEDIREITDKIESVKIEYAKELEGLKSQLNAKFHAQTVRFEKEFDSYKEIWGSLVEVEDHFGKLHLALSDPNPRRELTEAERKEFLQVMDKFCLVCEKNSPFFSREVYDEIVKFMEMEAVGTPITYSYLPVPTPAQTAFVKRLFDDLLRGPDSVFTKKIERIREAIRLRIQSF